MIGVVYLFAQSLIRELESVDQRIDQVADVERHSDRIDSIPNADEMDPGLLRMAVLNSKFLGRRSASLAAQQPHQSRSVTTAVSLVGSTDTIVESFCGRLLL